MKQRTVGNTICSRQWFPNNGTRFYVANVPGDGGRDWGYTTEPAKALPLNAYFVRRFVADCRRVGTTAVLS